MRSCRAIRAHVPRTRYTKTSYTPKRNDVRKLLGKSKIVAIPANYESFGIAQLEAFSLDA